jgi:ABC-type cobalamin/Fe3+-siderophores transport system ATPase subunit
MDRKVTDLSVVYGALVANDRVSLSVAPGRVIGLIGPNGAGKSTFVDALSGFTRYRGSVLLIDHDVSLVLGVYHFQRAEQPDLHERTLQRANHRFLEQQPVSCPSRRGLNLSSFGISESSVAGQRARSP